MITIKTNTDTNLKHEVERPGHDDGIVEGNHGGDGKEAIPCTESLFGQQDVQVIKRLWQG